MAKIHCALDAFSQILLVLYVTFFTLVLDSCCVNHDKTIICIMMSTLAMPKTILICKESLARGHYLHNRAIKAKVQCIIINLHKVENDALFLIFLIYLLCCVQSNSCIQLQLWYSKRLLCGGSSNSLKTLLLNGNGGYVVRND